MTRHRIFEAFRQARRPKRETKDWMPLAEAAQVVRMAQRGSDLDRIARGLGESEESLLAFWAQHVTQLGISVSGCRMLSKKREIISEMVIRAGRIRDQATRLEVGSGEAINDFGALEVNRLELQAALARLGGDKAAGD